MAIPKLSRKKHRPGRRARTQATAAEATQRRWRFRLRWPTRRAVHPTVVARMETRREVELRLEREVATLEKSFTKTTRLASRAVARERCEQARTLLAERHELRAQLRKAQARLLRHRLKKALDAEDQFVAVIAKQREAARVWDERGKLSKAGGRGDLAEKAWARRDEALRAVALLERDLESLELGEPQDWRAMYADFRRLAAEIDREFAGFRARANNQE